MLTALPILRENLSENQTLNFEDGKNVYNISVTPGKTYLDGEDYLNRLSGNYNGTSEISGAYQSMHFIPDINALTLNGISYQDANANIQGAADAIVNLFGGGNDVPSNNTSVPAPSDNMINHMGAGQQSRLFEWGLVYNTYRPDYSRVQLHPNVTNVTPYYYVGSKKFRPIKFRKPRWSHPKKINLVKSQNR